MDLLSPRLPRPNSPMPFLCPVVLNCGLAFVSGQLPMQNGELHYRGKVGRDIALEEAAAAARLCVLQCLSVLARELGGTDRIRRILKITGFVASAPGFTQQELIMDAASEALVEVLGRNGEHARSTIGVAELPHDAPVEIELIAAIAE